MLVAFENKENENSSPVHLYLNERDSKSSLSDCKETAALRYTKYSHQAGCTAIDNSELSELQSISKIIVNDVDHRSTNTNRSRKRLRYSSSDDDSNFGSTRRSVSPEISNLGLQQKIISSDEESTSQITRRSVSPEIPYGDSPAAYKLRELKGEFQIIKVAMARPKTGSKKCSEQEISEILNSDGDCELLFENIKQTRVDVVRSLRKSSNNPVSLCAASKKSIATTSRAFSCRSRSRNPVPKPTSETSEEDEKEEKLSMKYKIRRSTEKSNYTMQPIPYNGKSLPKSSRRSDVSISKRFISGNDDEQIKPKKIREISQTLTRSSASTSTGTSNGSVIQQKSATVYRASETHKRQWSDNYGQAEFKRDLDRLELLTENHKRNTIMECFRRGTKCSLNNEGTFEEIIIDSQLEQITENSRRDISDERDKKDNVTDKENESESNIEEDSFDCLIIRGRDKRKMKTSVVGTERSPEKRINNSQKKFTPKKTPRKNALRDYEMKKMSEDPDTPTTPRGTPGKRISRTVDTPSMKKGNLTPSMKCRTSNIDKLDTKLEGAKAKLHVSHLPKSLPCREVEFNNIYQFLEGKLLDKTSGCIYISGTPGTGKTATVNEVIRCLKKRVKKNLEDFDFIEINGMKLSEPRQAYVEMLKQISNETATADQAREILKKKFTGRPDERPMTLLLVDELDLLCNKRQDVIYNLLDWPTHPHAYLVVITIANTMDLPERVLMNRVTSRLGLTRLTFKPYTFAQLEEIVLARLKDHSVFKKDAMELIARKVASVSGDARRALDMCRRAIEIAESNKGDTVDLSDVQKVLNEMITNPKVAAIKYCSVMEKQFLQAVRSEIARTGVEESDFINVHQQLVSICSFEGLEVPNVTGALEICRRLCSKRLLLCERSRSDIHQRIFLNVSPDELYFATQTINNEQ
ncbi:origin recognition complex subunit 1 [Venturia canescens]|uniref:origin recognition complex subunit 1 n=1 Tax=Venturia canescens TaxID=32260 RepID=UPI001C9D5AE4|nr:origin recognition complex subunit 1 [Venturia canescens]XP_043286629.1 origin recognition complex subunit 1 [Venturia canescens]